jgi:maleate isomerase
MMGDASVSAYRRQTTAIGMITPSANIVVERVTSAILNGFPEVSGHFSRIPVFGSSDPYAGGYDWETMLDAARLLGHARLGVICWNGSKGGSLGFAVDRELCERITAATGTPATTSTLAIVEALAARDLTRLGLVTPYAEPYQRKIVERFATEGLICVAEAHADLTDNFSYCQISDERIVAMVRAVAAARPQAILTYCTNFPAAHLVAALEDELGIPIYDSVSAGVWKALRLAGIGTASGYRWGSLFGPPACNNR